MSYEQMSKELDYNSGTGELVWKKRRVGVSAGSMAGSSGGRRYMCVTVNRKKYLAHRVAWLLGHGEWPQGQIDHINHNKLDNRLINLRVVDAQGNARNRKVPAHNTSGVMGVCFHKHDKVWQAGIKVNGIRKHLGAFADWFDAVCVRKAAEYKHGFHKNHGRA